MTRQLFVSWLAAASLAAALPAAAHQQAQPPARPRARTPAATSATVNVRVADGNGSPLAGVSVRVSGPVDREATTDQAGAAQLAGLKAGTYRARFQADRWVRLERDFEVAARQAAVELDVMLTPAPPPPAPAPAPAQEAHAPAVAAPPGQPRILNVADFADRNLIKGSEPQRTTVIGCSGNATTRLLQVRDAIENRVMDDAEETLYVLAGDGTITMAGKSEPVTAGVLAVVPRGTSASLARRGKGPLVMISVVTGPPCAAAK